MVFQRFNLFPHMTVIDNITLGPTKVRGVSTDEAKRLPDLLKKVGIAEKENAYPSELSGGQQRVAIARALARNLRLCCLTKPHQPWIRDDYEVLTSSVSWLKKA